MTIINNDGSKMQQGLAVPASDAEKLAVRRQLNELECIDPATIIPLEYRVLLKVCEVEEMTEGGILKPETFFSKQLFSKTLATFVSCGEEAFTHGPTGDFITDRPQKGDTVLTAKYPGNPYRDKDFNLYRFCNDKDIIAIIK